MKDKRSLCSGFRPGPGQMGNHFRHPAEVPDLRLQGSKMVTGFLKLNSQFGFPLLQVGEPGGELLQLVRQFEVRLQGGDAYGHGVGWGSKTSRQFAERGERRPVGLVPTGDRGHDSPEPFNVVPDSLPLLPQLLGGDGRTWSTDDA